jgi:hypothetical protein
MTDEFKHYYAWGNNPKREKLKNKKLRIIARGKGNSRLIEFENGTKEIVSGNAIRKIKGDGDAIITPDAISINDKKELV